MYDEENPFIFFTEWSSREDEIAFSDLNEETHDGSSEEEGE